MWETLFFYVGLIHVIYFVYGCFVYVNKHCLRKKLDLLNRYGQGSWALVTGASRGIGAEFCKQLAKEGFNICLVSRTRTNLEQIAQNIKVEYPTVQTCLIEFDFNGTTRISDYHKLRQQIVDRDIDIGLLVLNAG